MQGQARTPLRRPLIAGRYAIYDEIAAGGMATVHLGRLLGPEGFSRTVAIKRLHSQLAKDPAFTAMFLDEARLASRVRQANVVPILDVQSTDGELLLVMEYVVGESLARLCATARGRGEDVPLDVTSAITSGMLAGLHAAHEARSERGEPLHLVHRDVSPQNVLVGADGIARLIDFGIAKARGRAQVTRDGQLKGKLAYMAPEQLLGHAVDRRSDVYAASVVLWLVLTGHLPFEDDDARVVFQILHDDVPPPSELAPRVSEELDALVLRGLSREPSRRFATALEMADALERIIPPATPREVAAWVHRIAGTSMNTRAERVARIEAEAPRGSLFDLSIADGQREKSDDIVAATSAVGASADTGRPTASRVRAAVGIAAAVAVAAAAGALAAGRSTTPLVVARTGIAEAADRAVAERVRPAPARADDSPPPATGPTSEARALPSAKAAEARSAHAAPSPKATPPAGTGAPLVRGPDPKYGF